MGYFTKAARAIRPSAVGFATNAAAACASVVSAGADFFALGLEAFGLEAFALEAFGFGAMAAFAPSNDAFTSMVPFSSRSASASSERRNL